MRFLEGVQCHDTEIYISFVTNRLGAICDFSGIDSGVQKKTRTGSNQRAELRSSTHLSETGILRRKSCAHRALGLSEWCWHSRNGGICNPQICRSVGERGFEPPTPWSRKSGCNTILLIRLGRLCVVLPHVRRFSALIGPKSDPSFSDEEASRRLHFGLSLKRTVNDAGCVP